MKSTSCLTLCHQKRLNANRQKGQSFDDNLEALNFDRKVGRVEGLHSVALHCLISNTLKWRIIGTWAATGFPANRGVLIVLVECDRLRALTTGPIFTWFHYFL
jgi:hypothetical protein